MSCVYKPPNKTSLGRAPHCENIRMAKTCGNSMVICWHSAGMVNR